MNITLATGRKSREMKRRLRREIQLWKKLGGRGGCRMELPFKESMSHKDSIAVRSSGLYEEGNGLHL